MTTYLEEEPNHATPDRVPNVAREAVCGCGHLIVDHASFWRTHERKGFPPEERLHRGLCMKPGCSCKYWATAEFRAKQ